MTCSKFQIILITLITLLPGCKKDDLTIGEKNEPFDKKINAIAVQDDIVWVGTFENGIYKLEDETWVNYTTENGLLADYITTLMVDNNNCVWIGTQSGLTRIENDTWTNFTTEDGLYSNNIRCLACDKENNIWIGTDRNRLSCYDGINFETYHVNPEASGDPGIGHIHTIVCDPDKKVWVGSCMTGLSMFDGSAWYHFVYDLHRFVEVSACDLNGGVWFSDYTAVYNYSDGVWTRYLTSSGLASTYIKCMDIDTDNNIWFGTDIGISKFDGISWTNYYTGNALYKESVSSLACGKNGIIWIGNFDGLRKYQAAE